MHRKHGHQTDRISAEFATRLDRLGPDQKVRAVVLLGTEGTQSSTARRQSYAERQAAIEAMRSLGERALGDIDDILERFDGKRLSEGPDALGSITVETTPPGIRALATSEWVRAIVEDQDIYSVAARACSPETGPERPARWLHPAWRN